LVVSQFSEDEWIPFPSGYTRAQGWNCLFRAWIGYKGPTIRRIKSHFRIG
jgi:hypothetical protein